jgi:hypothetical protein
MAQPNWPEILSNVVGGNFGVKVGPGVLVVVGWVAAAGLIATGAAVWALQSQPWAALCAAVLVLLVCAYFCERAFRYAEKHPIPALMGGAELLKVIEHQMAASDKALPTDNDEQLIGGAPRALENKSKRGPRRTP